MELPSDVTSSMTIPTNSNPSIMKRALLVTIRHVSRKNGSKFGSLSDLPLSHRDAKALCEFLRDDRGYHPDDITLMMDDKHHPEHLWPTHDNILQQIDALTRDASEDCHVFFSYSGHGLKEEGGDRASMRPDGRDGEIVCADGKPILDYILHDRLVTPLQNVKGSKLFALLDCCHSETLLDLKRGRGPNTYSRVWTIGRDQWFKALALVIARFLQLSKLCRKKRPNLPRPPRRASTKWRSPPVSKTEEVGELSVICLSACRDGQLALDDSERELTFTKCFLDTVRGRPEITWTELRDTLKGLVSEICKRYEETCAEDFDSESDFTHETWTQTPRYCTSSHTDLTRRVSL